MKVNLKNAIKKWAINTRQAGSHVNDLLKILREVGHDVPKDSRTLKKTPRKLDITSTQHGRFLTIGFKATLTHFIKNHNFNGTTIEIDLGLDGVMLYANTTLDCWPILFRIVGTKAVYTYGIWAGKSKPKTSDELMEKYVRDFQLLSKMGFVCDGRNFIVKSRAFVMDSPAKSLALGIKYPRGFCSCPRCRVHGYQRENRMIFLTGDYQQRTDADFRARADTQHHNVKSHMAIEDLPGLDLVKDVTCETMHNSFLGVTKLLIKLLSSVKGKPHSLNKSQFKNINDTISDIKWPKEFNRHLRPLDNAPIYKATELKNFLFYAGLVALQNVLDSAYYTNFLKFSIGIRILWNDPECLRNHTVAEKLLREFTIEFEKLYADFYVGFNVHALTHLHEDVSYFQCGLSTLSAFPFESQNMIFKKMVKTGNNCLEQLGNRIMEELSIVDKPREEALNEVSFSSTKKKSSIILNRFEISNLFPDCYCLIENSVFEIESLFQEKN